ncbi:MAG: hypothetical protein EZS28_001058 [Streblomastix strix]|uniref:Uncharacterized protein n=1 Tax=Streblomastix strix TaxID=222440 RepID=A0A5J4X844_9EUKA|nr:MAG: hypothetical protein EZS28_001058 [Streblomastix strix]
MKYDDENIPFDKYVKILGWNSSRFDIALLLDALYCELWTMCVTIGDLNNTKSITVKHKKSRMKLQFIDAENLFGPIDPKIASLHVKMRQYAIKNNVPITVSAE